MSSPRRALALLAAVLLATGAAVATASPALAAVSETTGGVAHTWTNYTNAGGTEGPSIGANQTVDIGCKLPGFAVADGNTWWYQVASSPWNGQFYVSADAFYNTPGQTSGSLHGTPFVDPSVPDCGASGPPPASGLPPSASNPTVLLAQGPANGSAYRYAITLSGFPAGSSVALNCYDSVSPSGFYPFSLTVDGSGSAYTASYCFSGDGPDHWVIANSSVVSNHVTWGSGSPGGGTAPQPGGSSSSGGTNGSSSNIGSSGSGPVVDLPDITTDMICGRIPSGTMTTTNAFGGSSTKFDHNMSLNSWCGGFGAPGDFQLSPAVVCSLLAVAASFAPAGYRVRDLCDRVSATQDVLRGELESYLKEKACGYLTDFIAGTAGVIAAGATSETGPGAVAVGVETFRVLEAVGTAVCGDLFSGAHQFGVDLETKHEHDIAVDVVRHGKCMYERRIFGQLSWSAGPC